MIFDNAMLVIELAGTGYVFYFIMAGIWKQRIRSPINDYVDRSQQPATFWALISFYSLIFLAIAYCVWMMRVA